MPHYKAIPYRSEEWYLLDNYCTTPLSNKSVGTTTIWFHDVPVWVMHYSGWYDVSAIGILKRALQKTYRTGVFTGGRGPLVYAEETLIYHNKPTANCFEKFAGREDIFDAENGVMLGYHEYSGMSLL